MTAFVRFLTVWEIEAPQSNVIFGRWFVNLLWCLLSWNYFFAATNLTVSNRLIYYGNSLLLFGLCLVQQLQVGQFNIVEDHLFLCPSLVKELVLLPVDIFFFCFCNWVTWFDFRFHFYRFQFLTTIASLALSWFFFLRGFFSLSFIQIIVYFGCTCCPYTHYCYFLLSCCLLLLGGCSLDNLRWLHFFNILGGCELLIFTLKSQREEESTFFVIRHFTYDGSESLTFLFSLLQRASDWIFLHIDLINCILLCWGPSKVLIISFKILVLVKILIFHDLTNRSIIDDNFFFFFLGGYHGDRFTPSSFSLFLFL